jgi:hypothetical protein
MLVRISYFLLLEMGGVVTWRPLSPFRAASSHAIRPSIQSAATGDPCALSTDDNLRCLSTTNVLLNELLNEL